MSSSCVWEPRFDPSWICVQHQRQIYTIVANEILLFSTPGSLSLQSDLDVIWETCRQSGRWEVLIEWAKVFLSQPRLAVSESSVEPHRPCVVGELAINFLVIPRPRWCTNNEALILGFTSKGRILSYPCEHWAVAIVLGLIISSYLRDWNVILECQEHNFTCIIPRQACHVRLWQDLWAG